MRKGKKREQHEPWSEGKGRGKGQHKKEKEERVRARNEMTKWERGTQKKGRSWMMTVVLVLTVFSEVCKSAEVSV